LPFGCGNTRIKDSKDLPQDQINYYFRANNLNNDIRFEAFTTGTHYGPEIKLSAPSHFAVDGQQLLFQHDRYQTHYLKTFSSDQFSNGTHIFEFVDFRGLSFLDSFEYYQPRLPENPIVTSADSLLFIKVMDGGNLNTLSCYLQKKDSVLSRIQYTQIDIKNGYLQVPLKRLIESLQYPDKGNYLFFADYISVGKLKSNRGKYEIIGHCKKPLTIEIK
jgi:hypothetical protein